MYTSYYRSLYNKVYVIFIVSCVFIFSYPSPHNSKRTLAGLPVLLDSTESIEVVQVGKFFSLLKSNAHDAISLRFEQNLGYKSVEKKTKQTKYRFLNNIVGK